MADVALYKNVHIFILNGEVKAVNAAILIDFDGSNLGVPAAEARRLLDKAIADRKSVV